MIRALGFDKPTVDHHGGTCSDYCSDYSYGHSGFTGTLVWADPQNGFIYVFLSNRVIDEKGTNKLAKMDIRTKIQDEFYKMIK